MAKEKGITDAVHAVRRINEKLGKTAFTLTIYGQVDDAYREEFERLQADFGKDISYGGEIPFEQGAMIVGQYFALLFPTRTATEGIPGTIIDAYAGGTPVLAAEWENAGEIIEDGKTGQLYPLGDVPALEQMLQGMFEHPEQIAEMRENCLEAADRYRTDKVLQILYHRLLNH